MERRSDPTSTSSLKSCWTGSAKLSKTPDARFATLAVKHDATAFRMVYQDPTGGVNAGNEVEFFNEPIPGKTVRVTGRIADVYWRRDKPYLVIEATAVDEDGRLLEKMRTYQMKKPEEVGKKWHPQGT